MPDKTIIDDKHDLDFYSLLKGDVIEIAEKKILFPVKITAAQYQCNAVLFKNCEFCGAFEIDDVDLKVGLRFEGCSFEGNIRFLKVKSKEYNAVFSEDSRNIHFKDCGKFQSILFKKCHIGRDVTFNKCEGITSFYVQSSYLDGVTIENSTIDAVSVAGLETRIGFRIHRSTITGQGRYENCQGDGFSFTNSDFKRDQSIWGCKLRSIITNNGTFDEELKISACSLTQGHTFSGTVFKQSVSIKMSDQASQIHASIEDIYLENCDFQGGFELLADGGAAQRNKIKKIVLKSSSLNKGNISFDGALIGQAELNGTNVSANISFRNCQIDRLNLSHFTNLGKLYFSDLQASSSNQSNFTVNKTSLGVTILLNVDLASYQSVDILHSHLTDLVFTDVKWFEPKVLNKDTAIKNPDLAVEDISSSGADRGILASQITSRDVYRQLKYAAAKQGDTVQSLIFQGLEMQLFNDELKQYRLNWNTAGNKVMMWLNKSNNYGNNWIKPIFLLLGVNLVFFFWITLIQSGKFCACPASSLADLHANFRELWKHNGAYWGFLNPVRRLSDVFPGPQTFNGLTVFLDYLSRIVVSYFIFQIVSAFRKYAK